LRARRVPAAARDTGARRLRDGRGLRRGLAGAAAALPGRPRAAGPRAVGSPHARRALRRRHREGARGRRVADPLRPRGRRAGGGLGRAQLRPRPARLARPRRRRALMGRLLLVAAGGALGSALRYMVATAALGWLGPAFPWGTLAA